MVDTKGVSAKGSVGVFVFKRLGLLFVPLVLLLGQGGWGFKSVFA